MPSFCRNNKNHSKAAPCIPKSWWSRWSSLLWFYYRKLLTSWKERAEKHVHHLKRGKGHLLFSMCSFGAASGSIGRLKATVEVICREMKKNQCFDALGDTRLDGSSWVRSGQETSFEDRSNEGSVQELCESRGGCPGLSVLTSLLVSVDVKLFWTMLRHWSQLVPNMSTDIWGH